MFLSSHSDKIVSLLEPVSYSADPVITESGLNQTLYLSFFSWQQEHCHHGPSRTVWQYYVYLLVFHAPVL